MTIRDQAQKMKANTSILKDVSLEVLESRIAELEYNPNQPRDPKGSDTGGQWTGGVGKYKGFENKKQRNIEFDKKEFFSSTNSKKYDTSSLNDAMGHAARWSLDKNGETYFLSMTNRGYIVSGDQSKVSMSSRFYEITAKEIDGKIVVTTILYESNAG